MSKTPAHRNWRTVSKLVAFLKGRFPSLRGVGLRWVLTPLVSVLLLLAVLNFGVAWYYSGVLYDLALEVGEDEVEYNLVATDVGNGMVKLEDGPGDGEWRLPGRWGLSWDGGNGMIGDIVEYGASTSVRRFTLVDGEPPRSSPAKVSSDIFPNDPYLAFGIEYAEVEYESPLGIQDAWQFEGDLDTWAIFVHGHRGKPGDGLSSLPTLHDLGMPALFITYRNDEGQPGDPSGIYQYGLTEWQDLHAVVEYVLSQPGAGEVVLIGHSMGGGIVVKFLYESSLAGSVASVILDSPVMDFNAPVDLGARQRNLPGFVSVSVKWISTLRFGLDWNAMDYLKDAGQLDVPILLIHGEDDTRVPIETSEALAELRPDLVTYSVYPDTAHADAWNTDADRYERELREFLLRAVR